jgi:hypothetical protein
MEAIPSMKISCLAIGALLAATHCVAAASYTISYQAVLYGEGSIDRSGVFGPAGMSLHGTTIQMSFSVDTSVGNYYTSFTNGTQVGDGIESGINYGTSSAVSATFTINGVTKSIAGVFSGTTNSFEVGGQGHSHFGAEDRDSPETNYLFILNLSIDSSMGLLAGSIFSPYTGAVGADPILTGEFLWLDRRGTPVYEHYSALASGSFTSGVIPELPDPPPSAVPLPAAFISFATTLGLWGFLTRHRMRGRGKAQ